MLAKAFSTKCRYLYCYQSISLLSVLLFCCFAVLLFFRLEITAIAPFSFILVLKVSLSSPLSAMIFDDLGEGFSRSRALIISSICPLDNEK